MTEILSQRIKAERLKLHLSMRALGERVNIHESTIASYEQNLRTPPLTRLIELANVFNCSLDYLAGCTNVPDRHEDYRNIAEFFDKKPLHYNGVEIPDSEVTLIDNLLYGISERIEIKAELNRIYDNEPLMVENSVKSGEA